uniref:Zinc finger, CCHC-type n=1 Tax=Tanacetum cinerariifolium TaxID=118510 RepID=A0A6L2JWW7_TANCI|nr:zinc finger, CCHC-type [Tanacetum cinerariifolium]
MAEEDAFLVDYVEGGLCIDNTDAGIVERCNNGSNKNKGKELWDSLESKYMAEDSSSKKFLKRVVKTNITNKTKVKNGPMRTTVVLVQTRNQSWNVGSVARLVASKGIAVVVKRTTQMLVVQERGLRTNPKTKVKTYEPMEDGSVLYMGDDHFAPVHDKGSVALEFSSRKTITLFNVLYVPKLRKNLVSGPMLNKYGYKQVYESNKYILSKSGVFVGFGYYNNGMFMLNLNKVPDDSDYVYMSTSTVVNSLLWHARLGHVHYKRMLEMFKDDLIPAIDENPKKCTTFWGCRAVVRLPDPKRKTLGEKGIDCIFVGYVEHSKAYMFYVIKPNDSISINSTIELTDAIFDENRFSTIPRPKGIIPNVQESQMDDHTDDVPNEILEPRKDPITYNEAMQSRDTAFWKEAIDDEIDSVMENNTWVLSDLPPGCKTLGCKWIFKRKMKVDGIIDKFKARLVIQGFRQKEGIDYFDTYAPVSRITTIRLLLALATIHNLVIHQMDVKTTFLNGDLDKEVYMKQPKGFVMPCNDHNVCKLVKSLYGLKQAPKQWHKKFDEVVLSSGFHLNQSDNNQNQVDKNKKFLSSRFSMKDMGEADVILGIKIKHENKGIVITQSHYIEKILKKFNREDCSPVSTPMDPVEKLKPNTENILSRFTSSPSRKHWTAITRIFKFIFYEWMGVPAWGGAISWASKKQTCITGSTIESEFVALAAAGKEAEWLRNLIHENPIWTKPIAPIYVRCDSAPTMARAYSQIYNRKSRHLGVRHSMVRELIRNSVISIEFVRMQHNLADHLTKGLARDLKLNSMWKALSWRLEHKFYLSEVQDLKGYVNMKFSRFKKLRLSFLSVHQWIGTHGL